MRVKINDFGQFLEFSSMIKALKELGKEEHLTLGKKIFSILNKVNQVMKLNLKQNTALAKFVKRFNLSIIDLDLLQISITKQTNKITYIDYLEKSILKEDLDYKTTVNKILNSNLIQNKYLILEDPFKENKEEVKLKSLNEIIFSKEAQLKIDKLYIEFPMFEYLEFGNFIENLYFLNKLCAFTNDEINKRHIGKLQYAYEQKVYHEYEYNLNNNNRPFCQYLKNNEVSLDEAIFLGKELHQKYNSSFRFDDKFISDCMKNDTINKLKDKEFIVTGRWNDDEISEETTSILFNLKKSKKEDEFFNIEQPKETFDNVCLNEETKNKILSTINQTKHSDKIFNEWGININYGKGITMNFAGLPGTGKTLTAKAVANYLGKDLLTIKFSELESPWVGVCEKNISKAFKNAKEKNAVLFFDEADSLTTKREGAVNWVVSRTNTLLKELECFEGVCIFATNFSENYDEAFNRRLTAHIQFTLPDEINLNKIFKIHFPNKKAPHKNVDFSKFSKKHVGNLSGGDVKNIVLNSARIASSEGANKIAMKHLESACDMVLTGKQNLNNYRDTTYMG